MRDIGSAGEHFFMGFCMADGVTANKCGADRHGWDVLVEVDQDMRTLGQHTLHEPLVTGKIQVKSTETKSLKVKVSVSNALKLATSPLPTFYVLLDFSEGSPPKRAFLRHVDEDLIKRTLSRVNKMVTAGEANKLHERAIVIDFTPGQEINLNDSSTFKAEIVRAVGPSAAAYAERKSAFLKSVGFDEGAELIRFQLHGLENYNALVNATLGMGGRVPIGNLQFVTTRFGQEDPSSLRESAEGFLEIGPVARVAEGTITFRNSATGASTRVQADAYFNPLSNGLPEPSRRIRFDCGLFDWFMHLDGARAGLMPTLDPDHPVVLEDLAQHLQILALLDTTDPLVVDVDFPGLQQTAVAKLRTEHRDYLHLLDAVDLLLKTKTFFQDRGALQLSLNELIRVAGEIKGLSAFLNNETEGTLKFYIDNNPELGQSVCLMPLWFEVSGRFYLAVIALSGELGRAEDNRYQLATNGVEMIYKTVIHDPARNRRQILEQVEAAVERFTTSLPVVNLIPALLQTDRPQG
ncbi:hypothetical protein [Pseudomonas hunanensis]|uniref:hypothetical protein n=1 Tax=Pseudomonas hunanensis TaxID=1247546 RepID=UPI0030D7BC77